MSESLLRPAALKEARAGRERGEISNGAIESDRGSRDRAGIRRQEDVGLKAVTDGEFRRAFWNLRFSRRAARRREPISATARSNSRAPNPKPMCCALTGKLGAFEAIRWSSISASCAAHESDRENDHPVAVVAAFPLRPRRRAGSDLSVDGRFLPRSRRCLQQGGARLCRCRLPLSAARRGQFRLSVRSGIARAGAERGDDPDKLPGIYARPDQCRDLRHSRRHDHHHASVPRQLPIDLRGLRRLRAGRRDAVQRIRCMAISWNTTPSAPAASSRCASCRKARRWCSAWSPRRPASSNAGTTSSAASMRPRNSSSLDQLCLSPQCGFASTEEGNVLGEEEQWAKLAMIVESRGTVWGDR